MQLQPIFLASPLLLALGASALAVQGIPTLAPEAAARLNVQSALTAPLVDVDGEGAVWVRDRGQRVHFEQGLVTFLPAFGASAAREWPVAVRVASASVGDVALDVTPLGAPRAEAERVVQARADFDGVHHLGLDGVEQTFVFHELPAYGELVVSLGVETELAARAEGQFLRFEHPTLGHVSVSEAWAVDAHGRRTAVERIWTGEGIDLVVPANFVAAATLPLTIDPVWSTFSSSYGIPDDGSPDIVFAGESNRYVVVWEEYTSQQNRDVFATSWDANLQTQGSTVAIDLTNEDWTSPAVAYSAGYDRALVVADVGLGTSLSKIAGRLLDVGTFSNVGASFNISSIGATQKSDADVGGSNSLLPIQSNFAVTWTREIIANQSNIEYRILDATGQFVTGITAVDNAQLNDIQPAIAPSLGDTALQGDSWTLAWIRDTNLDERGRVMAMSLYYNGNPALTTDPVLVNGGDSSSHPAVSSLLDMVHPVSNKRFAVVAYEMSVPDITRASGFQTDIVVRPVSGDYVGNPLNVTLMEDGPRELLQARPVVGTNGRSVFVAYIEEEPALVGADVYDVRMATGEFGTFEAGVYLSLAERRLLLGGAPGSDTAPAVATVWEGENSSTSIRGAAVWSLQQPNAPTGYGQITGAGFNYILPKLSNNGAVGLQYGDANENGLGKSSWLRIIGDQNRTSIHSAQARDLPPNQFGMLISSSLTGDVNFPGGSSGRLLLGGTMGRYTNQLASSGPNGRIDVQIDPMNIPFGAILLPSAVGQTWYFQLWHRDVMNGQLTSNFTNGCAVLFRE